VGAIDGTLVCALVPTKMQGRFRGRSSCGKKSIFIIIDVYK
jgi:hypothetical protein